MPKEKTKKTKGDPKIAKIGEFAEKKEDEEIPKEEKEEKKEPEVEAPEGEEISKELTPEEIKEKVLQLISEIGSRGLTEEQKAKFIENFTFWNGIIFNIFDVGENLKKTISKVHIELTPLKATLLYFASTITLITFLRPDILNKILGKKETTSTIEVKKSEEKPVEEKPTKEKPIE